MNKNKDSWKSEKFSSSKSGNGDGVERNLEFDELTSRSSLGQQSGVNMNSNRSPSSSSSSSSPVPVQCSRTGCINPAISHPDWDGNFCSRDCALLRCREIFMDWIKSQNTDASMTSSS